VGTPVFNFRLMVFQIVQKYMSASVSVAAEVGVVAMGPLANLCVYICFVGLALVAKKVIVIALVFLNLFLLFLLLSVVFVVSVL